MRQDPKNVITPNENQSGNEFIALNSPDTDKVPNKISDATKAIFVVYIDFIKHRYKEKIRVAEISFIDCVRKIGCSSKANRLII